MKKGMIIIFLLTLLASASGESITVDDVINHQWEASSYQLDNGRINYTFYFNFKKSEQKVTMRKVTDTKAIKWEFEYNYKVYLDDSSYHIRIYNESPDQPSFVIMVDENNNFDVSAPGTMLDNFESFVTIKSVYGEESIQGKMNADRVRIRTAPTLEGEQIGSLMKNEIVTILNESDSSMKIGDMESVWYKIRTSDGIEGWSYGYFIDINNAVAEVIFDTKNFPIARRIDEDMISNVNIIYRSESDAILNMDEVEPSSKVTTILDNPIKNKSIQILSSYTSNSIIRNLDELLEKFETKLSLSDKEIIIGLGFWDNFIIKTNNYSLRLSVESSNSYRLFIYEYSNKNSTYDYVLNVGVNKSYVRNFLGEPTCYSEERNIWIYESFQSLRQINIFFENETVDKIQLVSWGGI